MFLKAMESSAQVYEVQNKKLGYLRVWSYAGEEYHQTDPADSSQWRSL